MVAVPLSIISFICSGSKTVNIIISDPVREAIIKQTASKQQEELNTKYPGGTAVFGVVRKGIIVPKGMVPPNSEIQWNTARILKFNEKYIELLLPKMLINTETNKGMQLIGNQVRLPIKVNAKLSLIGLPTLRIQVEILGIDKDMVIVGIGFIPKTKEQT